LKNYSFIFKYRNLSGITNYKYAIAATAKITAIIIQKVNVFISARETYFVSSFFFPTKHLCNQKIQRPIEPPIIGVKKPYNSKGPLRRERTIEITAKLTGTINIVSVCFRKPIGITCKENAPFIMIGSSVSVLSY